MMLAYARQHKMQNDGTPYLYSSWKLQMRRERPIELKSPTVKKFKKPNYPPQVRLHTKGQAVISLGTQNQMVCHERLYRRGPVGVL